MALQIIPILAKQSAALALSLATPSHPVVATQTSLDLSLRSSSPLAVTATQTAVPVLIVQSTI